MLSKSSARRQGTHDDTFCRPEAAATRSLQSSVGAMMKIIDLAARETFACRLFLLLARAEAACGRGARTTEIHRAVLSRSAAKDGAMAMFTA